MRTYLQFLLLCAVIFIYIEFSEATTKTANEIKTVRHKKPTYGVQIVRHKKPDQKAITYGLATIHKKKPTRRTKTVRSKKPGTKVVKKHKNPHHPSKIHPAKKLKSGRRKGSINRASGAGPVTDDDDEPETDEDEPETDEDDEPETDDDEEEEEEEDPHCKDELAECGQKMQLCNNPTYDRLIRKYCSKACGKC